MDIQMIRAITRGSHHSTYGQQTRWIWLYVQICAASLEVNDSPPKITIKIKWNHRINCYMSSILQV